MARWPMLLKRGETWYSRVHVPLDLQPVLKRKEIWKTLRTSNLEEAKLASLRVAAEAMRLFQSLRARKRSAKKDPKALALAYTSKALSIEDDLPEEDTNETLALVQSDTLENFLTAIESGDATGLNLLLDSVLLEEELHVPQGQRSDYAKALLQAHLGVLRERVRRANNASAPVGPTVTALLELYLRERKPSSKAEAEVRISFRRFVEVVGDKPIKDVTKQDVRAFRGSLFALPSTRKASRGGKLSSASIKKMLGMCAAVFAYGVTQDLLESNVFVGGLARVMKEPSQAPKRLPYSREHVKLIFESSAFSKLTGAKKWLPLLALYTGARIEELGGLRVQDVRDTALYITPTDERRLKNVGSARVVPLHPELVRRGFMEYVSSLPSDGRLFPDLARGPHGKFTGSFSKWWARFTSALGLDDPALVFHSFRHGWKDAAREAGISEESSDRITGHANSSVGRGYGRGPGLSVLADAMGRIRFGIEEDC